MSLSQDNGLSDDTVAEVLAACLKNAIIGGHFSGKKFFHEWFREKGSAFLFVFKKNLKVTNIQMAELNALLRAHTKRERTGEYFCDFQCLSVQEFNDAINSIVESFITSETKKYQSIL